ncbi:MAG: A/G-specific adenine glycosylase [Planctomycetales bacterium]|nr:A/G-specific adenine glycosylase [Planctomycetales bacterium]
MPRSTRQRRSPAVRNQSSRRNGLRVHTASESELADTHDAVWLRRFRRALSAWYVKHARPLPWRETRDPYRIWISEIMLQQTTVVAVVPYFERFLKRFPTLADLATADEHDVLRLWEGLGYYSRARNLHRAAKRVVAELGGHFPSDVAELTELPGIGRYTAGAIASFAFDRRAPIVEANTLRLYCRLLGFRGDPRSAAGQRLLWSFAEHILPRSRPVAPRQDSQMSLSRPEIHGPSNVASVSAFLSRSDRATSPGQFNQALMELGATVCSPTEPDCPNCPVQCCCVAFAEGSQQKIPQPQRRPEITDVTEIAAVVWRNDRCLLRRRPLGERWAGLWDFPRFEFSANDSDVSNRTAKPPALASWLRTTLRSELGLDVIVREELATLKHGVTRFRITLRCFSAEHRQGEPTDHGTELRWVLPADLTDFPLSTTGRKLAKLLASLRQRVLFGD